MLGISGGMNEFQPNKIDSDSLSTKQWLAFRQHGRQLQLINTEQRSKPQATIIAFPWGWTSVTSDLLPLRHIGYISRP
jgi:hypothetical protein